MSKPEWDETPDPQLIKSGMKMLALEVEPELTDRPQRLKALVRRLRKREYSRGELLYAMDCLADDPDLDDKIRYGGKISAADFRRVIEPVREIRRKVLRPLTADEGQFGSRTKYPELTETEVHEAVDLVPELSADDFADRSGRGDDTDRWILKADARQRLESNA